MTHVSKNKLDKNLEKLLDELLRDLMTSQNSESFAKVIDILITDTELTMIKKRIGIYYLLLQNYNDMEIAKTLNVTRQTVYRMKLELYKIKTEDIDFFENQLNKLARKNKFRSIMKEIRKINPTQAAFRKKLSRL